MQVIHAPLTSESIEPLRADEVHVWLLPRPAGSGRAPLLALLAAYLGVAASEVHLLIDEHGRPRLDPAHGSTLDFNWSHSGEQALVALADGVVPGIDLEVQRPRPRALELTRRFFAADEAAWLSTLDEKVRNDAFLASWTAHEAVLKAIGRGIAFGLDRLSFRRGPAGLVLQQIDGDQPAAWQMHAMDVDEAAHACVAWRGGPRRIRVFKLVGAG